MSEDGSRPPPLDGSSQNSFVNSPPNGTGPSPNPNVSALRLPPSALILPFRALASLQLAVTLIAVYAAALAVGTFVESRYGADTARAEVYGAAWFAALHIVLGVNVLASLLIRFPWRRRQTGFVITHVGILVLLVGCAATRYAGVEAQLPVHEGRAAHVAFDQDQRPLELGFQVYLHQFRRKLDPGSGMPSHYSSRVDFLDRADPPKKLQEDVLITLNAPVDFTDPVSHRTYRLFQSSFEGPWTPGDPEFDKLVGRDHRRDQVYLSRLSVNYDPGRGLKYAGSLMIVLGIALVYYVRRKGKGGGLGTSVPSQAKSGKFASAIVVFSVLTIFSGIARADETQPLDWTAWRHLPTLAEGRVMPLDSFARETVEAVCGRAAPTLVAPEASPDDPPRRFQAAELLFRWLVEPERWQRTAFLAADRHLRRDLDLPTEDAAGRPLRGISPLEVEQSETIRRALTELQRRFETEGNGFRPTNLEKRLDRLMESYGIFQAISFNPKANEETPRRFFVCWRRTVGALQRLTGSLAASRRISEDKETRDRMVAAAEAWRGLIALMHEGDSSFEKIEPAVAAFRAAAERLAQSLASPDDAAVTALAADLRHQASQLHAALYDDGDTLRLVPALDPGAIEETRTPDDDASPWLGVQAMLYGSDALLAAYPWPELNTVRQAFAKVKAAYLDRGAADRPARFDAAMDDFAEAVRVLGERIEPLRRQLPLRHRDADLIAATAYPSPGSTDAEVFYNRLDPFYWSWVVGLAAALCLTAAVGRWQSTLFWLGAATLVVGVSFTAVGLGFRGYVTGLVPLTGMFETVVFMSFYAGLLGLWFALTVRAEIGDRRLFALAGAIVSFTAAVLAYYAPASVMHRNLGSVTPILRDNFWLAIHVVTIMASYASAAVALILGNIALGYYLLGRYRTIHRIVEGVETPIGRRPPKVCKTLSGFIYTAIRITVLLLAAGTILGAFWADNAWGRFWGWDPKENWALISLLAYALILHTRYLGWSADFGMAVAAVFGFTSILFTWYAVNFVLPTGLHSYGTGAGAAGQLAVGAAVVAEWLFLLAAAVRRHIETHRHFPPS